MEEVIKVISLDFWGTVAVFNPEYAKARTAYLAELFNLPEDEAHARYQLIKRTCDAEAEKKGAAITPLRAVKQMLEGSRVQKTALQVLEDIEGLVRAHPPIMNDDIKGTIFDLQRYKGYVVGVSSNTNFIRGALVHDLHDVDWDFEVYSDELGVSKPDPDFFGVVIREGRRAFEQRYPDWRGTSYPDGRLSVHDMLHIGDNSVCDQRGARAAGMMGWLTKSPQETLGYLDKIAATKKVPA